MERAHVNGVELEYEVHGSGEPVLLVHGGLLADENTPLALEPALTERYAVINYHRRGFAGSSKPETKATIETHAADAKALLEELGVEKTHVVGHSLGGTISIQLALDHPDTVHTLALMEPAIMAAIAKSQASPEEAVENQKAFMDGMARVNEVYEAGDKRGALTAFLETRAGGAFREVFDWLTTTGEFDQAVKDADTFLQVEMPAAYRWNFTPETAKEITQPVLSILGSHSPERAQKVHAILKQWLPQTETLVLPKADHALPLMDPPGIAEAVAGWLEKYPTGVLAGTGDSSTPGQAVEGETRLDSFSAACGIVWVVCAIGSFAIAGLGPGPGSKPSDFPKYFVASRDRVLASIYLRSVGQVFGFFFVGRLWKVLHEAEGDPGWLSQLAFASGIASHTLGVAGNAFHGAAAFRAREMSPNLAQTLYYLGSVFYAAGLVTPPFLAATGAVILRTNVLPRWLGWLAVVEAPVFLVGRLPVESRVRELFDLGGFVGYVVWTVAMSRKLRPGARKSPSEPRRRRSWKKPALAVAALAGAAAVAAALAR